MKHSERLRLFEDIRARYSLFLLSVLWKLTADREIFTKAMQYALIGIGRHVEKITPRKAGAYIYRIALTADSRAWRNRIGRNGHIPTDKPAPLQLPSLRECREAPVVTSLHIVRKTTPRKFPDRQVITQALAAHPLPAATRI